MTAAPTLLTGWGRSAPSSAWLERVQSDADVARLFRDAGPRGVLARGLGRSYGDAAQNAGGTVLDMTAITGILDFDATTGEITVEAGLSLDALMRATIPHGWFVPVTPGTRYVTVGGAIAANIHGKNHHRDGGFDRHVTTIRLRTPSEVIDAKPGDDAFDATFGGMGLTGVVVSATIRLLRIETSLMQVDVARATDIDDLMARMSASDDTYRYSVAWIDCLARGRSLGRGVLTRGDHAQFDELPVERRASPLAFAPRSVASVPGWVPGGVLRGSTMRVFNEAWYRRAPKYERRHLQSISAFFHPLDGVRGWNRLYGPKGFVQYQFVVPFGREHVVRAIVEELSRRSCPSFLAVLKRFGPEDGLLSFPIAGWTLAVDIPLELDGIAPMLDGWDRRIAYAGGRVYLAKDARLRPDVLAQMYPALDRWRSARERLDPTGAMRSDLARRLELV